jgi:hypothetical protein
MRLFNPKWKVGGVERDGAVWWLDAVVAGRRVRKSLGLRDRHAAQIRAAEIVRALELRASGLPVELHDGHAAVARIDVGAGAARASGAVR